MPSGFTQSSGALGPGIWLTHLAAPDAVWSRVAGVTRQQPLGPLAACQRGTHERGPLLVNGNSFAARLIRFTPPPNKPEPSSCLLMYCSTPLRRLISVTLGRSRVLRMSQPSHTRMKIEAPVGRLAHLRHGVGRHDIGGGIASAD